MFCSIIIFAETTVGVQPLPNDAADRLVKLATDRPERAQSSTPRRRQVAIPMTMLESYVCPKGTMRSEPPEPG